MMQLIGLVNSPHCMGDVVGHEAGDAGVCVERQSMLACGVANRVSLGAMLGERYSFCWRGSSYGRSRSTSSMSLGCGRAEGWGADCEPGNVMAMFPVTIKTWSSSDSRFDSDHQCSA